MCALGPRVTTPRPQRVSGPTKDQDRFHLTAMHGSRSGCWECEAVIRPAHRGFHPVNLVRSARARAQGVYAAAAAHRAIDRICPDCGAHCQQPLT